MKSIVVLVALFGLVGSTYGQTPRFAPSAVPVAGSVPVVRSVPVVSSIPAPSSPVYAPVAYSSESTVTRAFTDFTPKYKAPKPLVCDPDLAKFLFSAKLSFLPQPPCISAAPTITPLPSCCKAVHHYAYINIFNSIAVFKVPCLDICCKVCCRLPYCKSWSYEYSSMKCALFSDKPQPKPFYFSGVAGYFSC